jgi:hypothetical protein
VQDTPVLSFGQFGIHFLCPLDRIVLCKGDHAMQLGVVFPETAEEELGERQAGDLARAGRGLGLVRAKVCFPARGLNSLVRSP